MPSALGESGERWRAGRRRARRRREARCKRRPRACPASSASVIALTGPIAAGDIDSERKPRPTSAIAASGFPASSPHSVTGSRLPRPRAEIGLQRPQERARQRIEPARDLHVAAVARRHELEQIVRADRDEIGDLGEPVELEEQRRHLDHGAEQQLASARRGRGGADGWSSRSMSSRARRDLADLGHHRQHDAQLAPGRGLEQRADLRAQQARPVEPEPDRAPAHAPGSPPAAVRMIGQHLVAADVEGAEGHRPAARRLEHEA